MWALSGFVLSCILAAAAWLRSRSLSRTYYEAEVYGMGPSAHRRYAAGFAILAAAFGAGILLRGDREMLGTPLGLAVLTLSAILYGATFLRGASGEDE